MTIEKRISYGEIVNGVAGIAVAVGTLCLAVASFRTIAVTEEIYRQTQRPWLDVNLSSVDKNPDEKRIEVILRLDAASQSIPARFIHCFGWVTPEGAGSKGGGIGLKTP